jgi:hypothetical protein
MRHPPLPGRSYRQVVIMSSDSPTLRDYVLRAFQALELVGM